jgi:hypothetical protein
MSGGQVLAHGIAGRQDLPTRAAVGASDDLCRIGLPGVGLPALRSAAAWVLPAITGRLRPVSPSA